MPWQSILERLFYDSCGLILKSIESERERQMRLRKLYQRKK